MSQHINAGGSLIVTTNKGDYYVIPVAALDQFRATPDQQQMVDDLIREEGTGFYSEVTAADKSRVPDFASEDKTTARAWVHDL
jgi:hypothetical protein